MTATQTTTTVGEPDPTHGRYPVTITGAHVTGRATMWLDRNAVTGVFAVLALFDYDGISSEFPTLPAAPLVVGGVPVTGQVLIRRDTDDSPFEVFTPGATVNDHRHQRISDALRAVLFPVLEDAATQFTTPRRIGEYHLHRARNDLRWANYALDDAIRDGKDTMDVIQRVRDAEQGVTATLAGLDAIA